MKEGAPSTNYYEGEHVRGSAEGEISADMYPQGPTESDEDYAKRLADMQAYAEMAREDGEKLEAEKAAEDYANSTEGKFEAYLRSKVELGVYTDAEIDEKMARRRQEAEDRARYDDFLSGKTREEFEGEIVMGNAEGAIDFDMYPRQPGETPQQYGARLKEMRAYAEMAQEDGEKMEAEKAAAEYANSKLGKYEAYLRNSKEDGKDKYTPERIAEMVEKERMRLEDSEKYEAWLENRARVEEELGEAAVEAAMLSADENDNEGKNDAGDEEEGEKGEEGETAVALSSGENSNEGEIDAEDEENGEKGEKTAVEMGKELVTDWDFLKRNGVNDAAELAVLDDAQIKDLYDKWIAEKEKANESAKEALVVASVDKSEDAKIAARDIAERMLKEDLQTGGRVKRILKGIWHGQMARGYFIKRNERRAYDEIMRQQDENYSELNAEERRSVKETTIKRFVSEYDEMRHKDAGEWQDALPDDYPASIEMRGAIEAFAKGDMDEANFNEAMKRVKAMLYEDNAHNKNRAATDKGDIVIDNYLEIAKAARGRFEHEEGIESIMEGFKFVRGEARSHVRTEAHRTGTDKLIEKWENNKIGQLVPPELVAAAASVAIIFGKNKLNAAAVAKGTAVGAMVGGGVGATVGAVVGLGMAAGAVAAAKERNRVATDRAQMSREMAAGKEVGDTKYDRAMAETVYGFVKADELTGDLRKAMEGGDKDAIWAALANIETRNQLSDQRNIDLIGFSDPAKIEQERFDLDLARAEAKVALRSMGEENVDGTLKMNVDALRETLEEVNSDKDKVFGKLRRKQMLKIGVKAGVTAAATTIISQEVVAAFNPNQYGIADKVFNLNNNEGAQKTLLAGVLGFKTPDVIVGVEQVDPTVGSYDRELTPQEIEALESQGFTVTDDGYFETDTVKQSVELGADDYARQAGTLVSRTDYAGNGTPIPDLNELGAHYTGSAETGFGIVTKMTNTGSMTASGEVLNFGQLAEAGSIKAFISLTGDSQAMPIEVIGRLTANGQLEFIPEPGSVAAECFDATGKFIGKFFEVAVEKGVDANGAQQIIPLATVVGKGMSGATFADTITTVAEKWVPRFNVLGFSRNIMGQAGTVLGGLPIGLHRRDNLTNARRRAPEATPPTPPTPPEGPGAPLVNPPKAPSEIPVSPVKTPTPPAGGGTEALSVRGGEELTPVGEEDGYEGAIKELLGGDMGMRIMNGEVDNLSAEWQNIIFENWWNERNAAARSLFDGTASTPLTPKSAALREWLKNKHMTTTETQDEGEGNENERNKYDAFVDDKLTPLNSDSVVDQIQTKYDASTNMTYLTMPMGMKVKLPTGYHYDTSGNITDGTVLYRVIWQDATGDIPLAA